MKMTGAALAAALFMAGPALAQGVGGQYPDGHQGSTGGMGLESTDSTPQDVLPMPSLLSPEATGATEQEDVVPVPEAGGMMEEGATPQGGGSDSMDQPRGSRSTGEFGTSSGSSLDTETDMPDRPGAEQK